MAYRNYAPSNGFIVAKDGTGDFSTIGAALTASTSGTTIFIRPGTYTENPALVAGVNLCAFPCDSGLNQLSNTAANVIIQGKCTFSSAGTVSISGIQLQTNSDYFLAVTGSAASIVILTGCYLNCLNNTGIDYTSSSGISSVNISYCQGNIGTTAISLFTATSAGTLDIQYTDIENSGGSTTASTTNATVLNIERSLLKFPISMTASNGSFTYSEINSGGAVGLTTATSGTVQLNKCLINSQAASAVSVGASTIVNLYDVTINSSATNALTGGGTINQSLVIFSNTSATSNVTTLSNMSVGITGTFSPALSFGGSTTGITYTTQAGAYVVIGKMVFVSVDITLSSKGSQTGNAAISLPFTSANNSINIMFSGYGIVSSFPSSTTVPISLLGANSSSVGLYGYGEPSTITQLTNSNFSNTSVWRFSGWYSTA